VPDSPPGRVLQAARSRRLTIVASWELVEEIVEVLRRPKLRRYKVRSEDLDDLLVLLAPSLPSVEMDFPVRDVKDTPVVAAAVAAGAEAVVSGDKDFLDHSELRLWLSERNIEVLTPRDVLARLERL
jgi:uncharacterized protein